jgi:hypothetical protein
MPNPTTNLADNGRRVRHCRQSMSRTTVRTDADAQNTLKLAKERLSGNIPGDIPSASMIVRRALQIYRRHLLSELHGPYGIEAEYNAIREGTIMPTIRKHREEPPCPPLM